MKEMTELNRSPSYKELRNAVKSLKNNKSPDIGGIPTEIYKIGRIMMINCLDNNLFTEI